MGATAIGWTEFSVNPIRARLAGSGKTSGGYSSGVGHYCEKVSQGCARCYSSALQPKFGLPQFQDARNGAVESFFDGAKLEEVLRRKKPTRFFWCDMTDMFGSWVPFEWIAACFGAMAATPRHAHQVLTKRPERALEFFSEWLPQTQADQRSTPAEICRALALHFIPGAGKTPEGPWTKQAQPFLGYDTRWPLPNVHLGVSVEDQANANKRIPLLLQCPTAVRWISYEPALGPLNLHPWLCRYGSTERPEQRYGSPCEPRPDGLSWLVAGGESGHGHRECDPAWIDAVVSQCVEANVSVFVKQDSGPRPGKQGRLSDATWARKEFPRPSLPAAEGGSV